MSATWRQMVALPIMIAIGSFARGGEVHARFDLRSPAEGPFPSDRFTVSDHTQLTGRRVNLPLPDCYANSSDCEDLAVVNTLDGFNVEPRLSIPFDGPIDSASVTKQSVFLVGLVDRFERERHRDDAIGINQVVWDPATLTLHAKANKYLDQHTRYALIVTRGVRDAAGAPVEASDAFRRLREHAYNQYERDLQDAIEAAARLGIRRAEIVAASVFTTQSVTATLEKIRDQIHSTVPEAAEFNLGSQGQRTIFALNQIQSVTWNQQIGDSPARFSPSPVRIDLLASTPEAVSQLAFGRYRSPDYQVHPGEFIPPVETRTGVPLVQAINDIYFDLYLPSGQKPTTGWPVAILGHGGASNKEFGLPRSAASLAARGIASIVINIAGHGFGSLSTLTVTPLAGVPVTFSAGGRGVDQNGDGTIESAEGRYAAHPRRFAVDDRDCSVQTIADLLQLVRLIEAGVDADGDGSPDLDPGRIYFFGQSYGASLGAVFVAVEPKVRAAVFISPGPMPTSAEPLSPFAAPNVAGRTQTGKLLAGRIPSLINYPGVITLGQVPTTAPYFRENLPLRKGFSFDVLLEDGTSSTVASPLVNTVSGAMKIQEVLDWRQWVMQSANSVAYAVHLRKSPLPGVPAKRIIIQAGKGDQTLPNPGLAAIARAGDLRDRITFYRNDLAFAEDSGVPKDPHTFAFRLDSSDLLVASISRGVQDQMAVFFASDGKRVIQPQPFRFFETPIVGPLPNGLSFIP
jgi:dienelactone hydrolase